jgi:D-alanyl-D-alanine dipeptidase/acetyl esterase/lipase
VKGGVSNGLIAAVLLAGCQSGPPKERGPWRESDLVEIAALDPTLRLDVRYATTNNFLRRPVYGQARVFLQRPAAEALVRAGRSLRPRGYGLLVFDGYRPWSVTKLFWDSASDEQRRIEFVADPRKGSRHNRGCAVDLTLYELASEREVGMPSAYDEFSDRAFPDYPGGTAESRALRDLLRQAMEAEGFTVYKAEWWHFDFRDWTRYRILDVPFEGIEPVRAAVTPAVVEIWPGAVPDESGNIGPERVRMSPGLDRKQVEVTEPTRMITDVTRPTLTICRPAKDKNTGTALLICPGGGYWNLYWQLEGEEVAAWLNSIGVTGIILKYRVPRRPDEPQGEPARRPLQDAQRAVSLVRSRAAEWGIHPQRIGIVGFSAGGHLAIATATNFEKRTYQPVDDADKTSCRPDFAVAVYSGYLKAKDKDELAPGLRIPAGTPPVFLAHGGADIISPPQHSVLMYLALERAGVPAELHIYAGAAHDFGVRAVGHPCSTWTDSCANWLRHQGFLGSPAKP